MREPQQPSPQTSNYDELTSLRFPGNQPALTPNAVLSLGLLSSDPRRRVDHTHALWKTACSSPFVLPMSIAAAAPAAFDALTGDFMNGGSRSSNPENNSAPSASVMRTASLFVVKLRPEFRVHSHLEDRD